jgi:anionic cell wall polymer biosynthesis LytR-Cps2A-Psr (LCP) family protein
MPFITKKTSKYTKTNLQPITLIIGCLYNLNTKKTVKSKCVNYENSLNQKIYNIYVNHIFILHNS